MFEQKCFYISKWNIRNLKKNSFLKKKNNEFSLKMFYEMSLKQTVEKTIQKSKIVQINVLKIEIVFLKNSRMKKCDSKNSNDDSKMKIETLKYDLKNQRFIWKFVAEPDNRMWKRKIHEMRMSIAKTSQFEKYLPQMQKIVSIYSKQMSSTSTSSTSTSSLFA